MLTRWLGAGSLDSINITKLMVIEGRKFQPPSLTSGAGRGTRDEDIKTGTRKVPESFQVGEHTDVLGRVHLERVWEFCTRAHTHTHIHRPGPSIRLLLSCIPYNKP